MSVHATKRVNWKTVDIGDYASVVFDYVANNDVRIIPKAKGVLIRPTSELGGGYLTISVNALVAKEHRFELEQYFYNMDSNFSLTEKGDLVISDDNGTMTLSDCYLESFSQSGEDLKAVTFSMKFIKSL